MKDRSDRVALFGGLALVATGAVLWLDQAGEIDLSLGLVAAIFAAVLGLVLLLSGLDDDGR